VQNSERQIWKNVDRPFSFRKFDDFRQNTGELRLFADSRKSDSPISREAQRSARPAQYYPSNSDSDIANQSTFDPEFFINPKRLCSSGINPIEWQSIVDDQ
jgi:hypothetical protein